MQTKEQSILTVCVFVYFDLEEQRLLDNVKWRWGPGGMAAALWPLPWLTHHVAPWRQRSSWAWWVLTPVTSGCRQDPMTWTAFFYLFHLFIYFWEGDHHPHHQRKEREDPWGPLSDNRNQEGGLLDAFRDKNNSKTIFRSLFFYRNVPHIMLWIMVLQSQLEYNALIIVLNNRLICDHWDVKTECSFFFLFQAWSIVKFVIE